MPANSNAQLHSSPSLSERLYGRLSAERAKADLQRLERLTRRGPLGIVRAAVVGFTSHYDTLWASALTYTFSLSLIPILAVALSTVKGLIGTDAIKPVIEQYLAIKSPELTDKILSYVGQINAATLGTVGSATLLVTVLLTLGTIERALNTIFNVPHERTWLRKFTDYLSITFTIPVLLAVAVSLKSSFAANLPRLPGLGWMAATLPIWVGFSFLYLFFPNRRVRWDCAALGGLVAAILLEIGQWAYIRFQVSAGRYQAIYGALAAVPILLTWIYIAWTIVLAGAELAAAAQGTEAAFSVDYRSPAFVRIAVLLSVFRAAERALSRNAPACSIDSLATELDAPPAILRPILDQLQNAGIVIELGSDSAPSRSGLFLTRDSSELTVAEIFESFERLPENIQGDERISAVLKTLAATEHESLSRVTVKDLVLGRFGRRQDLNAEPTEAHA
ncbi:MAG: YihY family inner membrane protein [Deltaproteobacteria bacterium]|nr:YihY family inner membrane protein [Deltaproteobacteria bacterium]